MMLRRPSTTVLLGCLTLIAAATVVLSQDYYINYMSPSQTDMCANGNPNTTTVARNELDCVRQCEAAGQNCSCVNYRKNATKQCSLYMYIPLSAQYVSGCRNVQRVNMCEPPRYYEGLNGNETQCSFPFTQDGVIYYNCTTKMPGFVNLCTPPACYRVNRTASLCRPYTVFSVYNWIVVHNRPSWSNYSYVDVNWNMAASGYGTIVNGSDFWLGLERMYQLTSANSYRLRFELQQMSSGLWYSAEYWWFSIGDGTVDKYRIQVTGYSGDAGDSMDYRGYSLWTNNGMKYTTYDNDNDMTAGVNCADTSYNWGPWWFNICTYSCTTCLGRNYQWNSLPSCVQYYQPPCLLISSRIMMKLQ